MGSGVLIRVYGDSLSLPRAGDGIPYTDTYPELLAQECRTRWPEAGAHLYNRSHGGHTIGELWSEYRNDNFYFGDSGGDILVVQCGVVDCAPRPIPESVRRVISALPGPLKSVVINFLHHNRARMLRSGFVFRKTKPARCATLYKQWLSLAVQQFAHVYALNIAPTTPAMEAHSPGFSASIERYNDLIATTIEELDAPNLTLVNAYEAIVGETEGLAKYINGKDGHHLTLAGQRLYADLIVSQLGPELR